MNKNNLKTKNSSPRSRSNSPQSAKKTWQRPKQNAQNTQSAQNTGRGSSAPAEEGLTAGLLNTAIEATTQLLQFLQPADAALSAFFRSKKSGARDRAFIAETAYAVLRRKRLLTRLGTLIPPLVPTKKQHVSARELVLLSLSRLRGMSQRQLEPALEAGEAEWLAEIRRQPEPALTLGEQLDFPDWLAERLSTRLPADQLLALARALNTPAPLDLRVNTLKTTREAVVDTINCRRSHALALPLFADWVAAQKPAFSAKAPALS
jgi:16S rRNA (cytosine967-C5)-methyltransferase